MRRPGYVGAINNKPLWKLGTFNHPAGATMAAYRELVQNPTDYPADKVSVGALPITGLNDVIALLKPEEKHMRFTLETPCASCPFRTDVKPIIPRERAEEILDQLLIEQTTVPCISSLNGNGAIDRNTEACAGAMILREKMQSPHMVFSVLAKAGIYHPSRLNMQAPVYEDDCDMVAAHRRHDRPKEET